MRKGILKKELAFAKAPPKEVDFVVTSNFSSNSDVTSPTVRNEEYVVT